MNIVFKKSLPFESKKLSHIAITSKGHWGHSQEQLDLWREGLTIKEDYIQRHTLRTIYVDNTPAGFFAIVAEEPPTLDHLWLLPEYIGKGIGAKAIAEIRRLAKQLGIESLRIISDPNAEGFYLHQGATKVGEFESIPQNRMLPVLQLPTP